MRVVLDTNVFISGIFFTGPPHVILQSWKRGEIALLISEPILEEYQRVGNQLSKKFRGVDLKPFLSLLVSQAEVVRSAKLPSSVCSDPDDDKFLACAVVGGCKIIVSGDKALLKASGYGGIQILRPRTFVDRYL